MTPVRTSEIDLPRNNQAVPMALDAKLVRLSKAERNQLFGFPWVLSLLVLVVAYYAPTPEVRWETITVAVLLLLSPLAYLAGMSLKWVIQFTTGICAIGVGLISIQTGGIHSSQIAWLLLIPVMPLRLISVRAGLGWMGLCVLYIWMVSNMDPQTFSSWVIYQQNQDIMAWAFMQKLFLCFCLLALPWYYAKTYRQSIAVMRQQSKVIHQKKSELIHEQANKKLFISRLSHEMRTPMNAVVGFSHLLESEAEQNPQVREVVQHIQTTSKHLLAIINGIMDYTQLIDGQLVVKSEVVDVHKVLNEVFNMYAQRLRSMQVEYTCDCPIHVPRWMRTDGTRLTQIIISFLEHSLQRTSDGFLHLDMEKNSQNVVISVHDSGDHIDPEELRVLNAMWSSAKEMPDNHLSGPGMGVCMAKALAHLMGGDVSAINHPGKGSSLSLRLPLHLVIERNHPLATKPQQEDLQINDLTIEVLVVDDSPVNRLLVSQVIAAQWGKAKVVQADNGIKALDRLHQQKFDLVLMDMLMPEMDGIEATKHLRQSDMSPNQWIPVLGLTANISTEDHVRCLSAGMNDILLKPFDKHVLVTRIEELLLACPLFTTKHAISSGPRRVKVFE